MATRQRDVADRRGCRLVRIRVLCYLHAKRRRPGAVAAG